MILTDTEIRQAIGDKAIAISPFREEDLRINSYDVHLGDVLLYSLRHELDAAIDEKWGEMRIPEAGLILHPGTLYLGVTREYTESHRHVPYLDGKSSVGRLGCFIHATAGRGDVGFCGRWTMEISVVQPLRVYAGMPIGQLTWHTCGIPSADYRSRVGSAYGKDSHAAPRPVPSALWKKLAPPTLAVEFRECFFCGDPTRHRTVESADPKYPFARPLCRAPDCRSRALKEVP